MMLWLWAVSLCSAALSYATVVPENGQLPLGQSTTTSGAIWRRYALSQIQQWSLHDILQAAERRGLRFWNAAASHVDILFERPDESLDFLLHDVGSVPTHQIEDTMSLYRHWNLSSFANSTYHSVYHPLSEIEEFMEDLAREHPRIVELAHLGHTGEGREMLAMKLSKESVSPKGTRGRDPTGRKTGIVITGAQHAREWIATSTALYLAHSLVADESEEFALSRWLEYFDFYVIPVPNPDGYVHTWETDRFWYKNRQILGPEEKCIGIDMNRNWGHKWKSKSHLPALSNSTDEFALYVPGRGADADPCSTWYPGHRPFEAPEVNNIANYIQTLPSLKAFIDFRSYGQMLSTPFSWSCKKTPKDAEDQLEAAHGAANAIKQVHGTVFSAGTLCDQLYKASGNVVDYMYAKAGIKYSFSVHLRDTGTYGFSLPAEWIRPVGEETANMIRFIATFIAKKQKLPV